MDSIAVIMPIYNRVDQAISALARLRLTAGVACRFIAVGGSGQTENLKQIVGADRDVIALTSSTRARLTYWEALQYATAKLPTLLPETALIATVASDVLPAMHWLKRAYTWHQEHMHDDYMIGFNGDGWAEQHACHFMLSVPRLHSLGGWPTWYDHNYGDTELCHRANELKRFYKHPWAILYHDHPVHGGASDSTYTRGNDQFARDAQLFEYRRNRQWIS
jgi:GT2 family glycosyltransferase